MTDEKKTQSGAVTDHAPTTQELSAQMDALKQDISDISHTLRSLGRQRRDEAVGSARARAGEMRSQLDEWAEESVATVRQRPVAALGIAVVFGFMLGLLGGRK